MKREFTNAEIEKILTVLNGADSFIVKVKIPPQIRQALRVNRKALEERMQVYQEGRAEIIRTYIANDHARVVDDTVEVDEPYRKAIAHELQELAVVKNDIEFQKVDDVVLEHFLNTQNLTMAEEDFLLTFKE